MDYSMSVQIVTNSKWTTDLVTIAESTEQTHKKNLGQITVYAEEVVVSKIAAELRFKCSNLENKDFFSKSVSMFYSVILYCDH